MSNLFKSLLRGLLFISAVTLVLVIFTSVMDTGYEEIQLRRSQEGRAVNTGTEVKDFSEEELNKITVSGGTGTGLNLLLIANIPNECYLKELLNMYKDYTQGALTRNNTGKHLSVGGILGIQVNETGHYDAAKGLPKSYLPWDSNTHSVVWKQDWRTYKSGDMLLRQLNHNMINQTYVDEDPNKISYYVNGMNKTAGTAGELDIGPFQIRRTYFGTYGGDAAGAFVCPTVNGYGESSNRLSDTMYLPDMLQYFDRQVDTMLAIFDPDDLKEISPKMLDTMYSRYHNGGIGSFQRGSLGFKDSISVETCKQYNDLYIDTYKYLETLFEDAFKLPGKSHVTTVAADSVGQKVLGTYLGIQDGWILSPGAYNSLFADDPLPNGGSTILSINSRKTAYFVSLLENKGFGSESEVTAQYITEVKNMFKARVLDPTANGHNGLVTGNTLSGFQSSSNGSIMKIFDYTSPLYDGGKVSYTANIILIGHAISTAINGDTQYARSLKLAGVDVDPTNPDTYLNKYEEADEWVPSTSTDFLTGYGIDVSNLSAARIKFLTYANSFNDGKHPYLLGGGARVLTEDNYQAMYDSTKNLGQNHKRMGKVFERDSSGKLVYEGTRMFDCATFINYCFEQSFGVTLGYNASGIKASSNTVEVPNFSDGKAGDLVYIQGHIAILLKYDSSTKKMVILESTPEKVKISERTIGKYPYNTIVTFLRPVYPLY